MRIIIGKTGSGKTAAVIREIREHVEQRFGRVLMLVPEQYTHEAERELSEACGDTLSLYGEVLSFTGLARLATQMFGDTAGLRMDEAGRLLCLNYALHEIRPMLCVFARAASQADTQKMLLRELKTIRTASADSGRLREIAEELSESDPALRMKLRELALLMESCDTVTKRAGAASEDPLADLARKIEENGLPGIVQVYVDGFIDFTGLELEVLKALMKRKIPLTVCMTGTEEDRIDEHFLPSKLAILQLREAAEEIGDPVKIEYRKDREDNMLQHFAEHLFDYTAKGRPEFPKAIRLVRAENPREECEAAAAEVLRLVREKESRWRDIAVAIRGYEDYRCVLEDTFRRYGIPLFTTSRDSVTEKTVPHWIGTAYDIILGNWDTDDVTEYLRCGFSGLSEAENDVLTAYLFKWQLKKRAWLQAEPWAQHPDGFGCAFDEKTEKRLKLINEARRKAAKPLLALQHRAASARTAREHCEALTVFLNEARFIQRLQERVDYLEDIGEKELAAEYCQIWDICATALEQTAAILGETEMDTDDFRNLFQAVLSHYDIGLIPISLDLVSAGDFDRMRRRNIRHLLVLGCNDERLPGYFPQEGIFTSEERDVLARHSLPVGGGDLALWKEYALIYHTFSLPSESLVLFLASSGFRGEQCFPSLIVEQAKKLYHLEEEQVHLPSVRMMAERPAYALAAGADRSGSSPEAKAAQAWFLSAEREQLLSLQKAARAERGTLSKESVSALYGKKIRLSHSRLAAFSDCPFHYYCRYGLRAKEWETAEYRPPEIGTFLHDVLEKTGREVAELGGFKAVTDEQLKVITRKYIQEYFRDVLQDGKEKSERFLHLFRRLSADAERIVLDTAEELRRSEFVPLFYEYDISELATDRNPSLTGIADRVDGWIRGDKLYLRVVDYKTGKKSFSLSDVCYGRDLQLLLYLFTLCDSSKEVFGIPGVPAGVLYQPAKDGVLRFDRDPGPDSEEKERRKDKRRTGLVLDDPVLQEAWENGEEKNYIPVKIRGTDPIVSLEKMDVLRRHVERCVEEILEELAAGQIDASPAAVSDTASACDHCPYHAVCRFAEGENGDHRRLFPKLSEDEAWERMEKEES